MDARTTSTKMKRDTSIDPSVSGHGHRRPGDDLRQSSAMRLSPPRKESPKPRDARDRDRARDSFDRDRDRDRERERDREKERLSASASKNRELDRERERDRDRDDDTGGSDASNAETIVLSGKDGYSPSKVRKVKHERDREDHDANPQSSPRVPSLKLPKLNSSVASSRPNVPSIAGGSHSTNSASDGPSRGILSKKNKIIDKPSNLVRSATNASSASIGLYSSSGVSAAVNGNASSTPGGSPPPIKRRRQSNATALSAAPSSAIHITLSDSESESYTKSAPGARDKPSKSSASHEKSSFQKRKIIKTESDDEGEVSHKARRPRVSDSTQSSGQTTSRGTKESSRPSKPEIPPLHSILNSPAASTRSLSPHSKPLHRRTQSTNGVSVTKKRRTPAPIHPSDYKSDNSSDDESPRASGRSAVMARGVAERVDSPASKGPSKKHLDAHGQTLLARACAKGEYEQAKMRLQERPEDLNVADYAGNTPLQIAALHGCDEIVALLLEKGCNKHCINYDKETPLLDAVDNGHVEVVRLLLEAGVNPRKPNSNGEEPLARVTSDTENGPEIRQLLEKAKATYRHPSEGPQNDDTAYHSEDASIAEINHSRQHSTTFDSASNTPFGLATSRHKVNARTNKTSNRLLYMSIDDKTLRAACAKGDKETVNHLLGIRQDFEYPEAITAAARGGYDDIVDILLGCGAPADPSPIKSGPAETATPILASIGQDNIEVMKLLLAQADFDPTRYIKGKRYYEIARERQGFNWKEEEDILKSHYETYRAKFPDKARANERESTLQSQDNRDKDAAMSILKSGSGKRLTSPSAPHDSESNRKKLTSKSSKENDIRDKEKDKSRDAPDVKKSSADAVDSASGKRSSLLSGPSVVKTKKRDKERGDTDAKPCHSNDREASPVVTKKKVKRTVDSEAPASSDGEASKVRRKLISKGDITQEQQSQKARRMSMASNTSSLNLPSSPHDRDETPSTRSSKGEISEKYHDRTKALKRDESHSGHDSSSPSAKRHRTSISPSGVRSEGERDKVKDEAEAANTSKRRRLDSELSIKDSRLDVPRKRVDKSSDSEKGMSSMDKDARTTKSGLPGRETSSVVKSSKSVKEARERESAPHSNAGMTLKEQIKLKKQTAKANERATKTMSSFNDGDIEMKDITVPEASRTRKDTTDDGDNNKPQHNSHYTSDALDSKSRRKLDDHSEDHDSRKAHSIDKEEFDREMAKQKRDSEKERLRLAEEKERILREEKELERKEAERLARLEKEKQERFEREREEERKRKAEEEAKRRAEEEERRRAEHEARCKAELEAKRKAEAERKAAEEARLRAEEEAERQRIIEQKRIAEEKAAEEARLKAEAEERRKQREREEAERRRQEQLEREEAERLAAEREKQRLEKERQEREAVRLARLPAVLRWLETCDDPQRPSFAEKFRVMQGVRWDTMDSRLDGTPEGREQWVLNTQAALLLGEKDISLPKYSSWQRIPVSRIAKIMIWRVENDRYSLSSSRYYDLGSKLQGYYNQENNPYNMDQETLNRIRSEAEERFFELDMFFVKVSDLLDVVPSMPHLRNIKLSVEYRELPETEEKLKGLWSGNKWRSDPDVEKYRGFAPRRRYFINGEYVRDNLPGFSPLSRTPAPIPNPVPRRSGVTQVFPHEPDYVQICKEQNLEYLIPLAADYNKDSARGTTPMSNIADAPAAPAGLVNGISAPANGTA